MDKFFRGLLVFIPVTIIAYLAGVSPIVIFFLSTIAIMPLARFIGEATEQISVHTGPAIGGLLNVTFGNCIELMIGIFALSAGLTEVVKASITGSIIGNLLFVLGTAMLAGGLHRKKQVFNRTGAMALSATLLLAVVALVMPAVFVQTSGDTGAAIIEELSIFVSGAMLLVYFAGLIFSLHTHKHLYTEEVGKVEDAKWSKRVSIAVLFFSTASAGLMSELLVSSIEPVVLQLGWTELFVGVIFIAIVANAVEHTSAITLAIKNRMDLALQVSIGSATQIVMFVAPILVLVSLLFEKQMSLVFNLFELVAIVLSVLIVNLVVEDGESTWLEGLQLLMAYVIMAICFFFHP